MVTHHLSRDFMAVALALPFPSQRVVAIAAFYVNCSRVASVIEDYGAQLGTSPVHVEMNITSPSQAHTQGYRT